MLVLQDVGGFSKLRVPLRAKQLKTSLGVILRARDMIQNPRARLCVRVGEKPFLEGSPARGGVAIDDPVLFQGDTSILPNPLIFPFD